jgi:hypothetical protein
MPDLRLNWKRLIFGIAKFVAEKRLSGSGGYWEVLDESADPTVIKQFNDDACAAACGEMLLIDRGCQISQQEIARCAGGVPMEIAILALALNQLGNLAGRWIGAPIGIEGATDEELLRVLMGTGSWAAGFWEDGAPIGHVVVVDGFDEVGRVLIRDPWGLQRSSMQGVRYKMTVDAFLDVWSRQAVYFVNL